MRCYLSTSFGYQGWANLKQGCSAKKEVWERRSHTKLKGRLR